MAIMLGDKILDRTGRGHLELIAADEMIREIEFGGIAGHPRVWSGGHRLGFEPVGVGGTVDAIHTIQAVHTVRAVHLQRGGHVACCAPRGASRSVPMAVVDVYSSSEVKMEASAIVRCPVSKAADRPWWRCRYLRCCCEVRKAVKILWWWSIKEVRQVKDEADSRC